MRVKFVLILIINLLLVNIANAGNDLGLTKEIYSNLCGVWDNLTVSDSIDEYSWGQAKINVNNSYVFDFGKNNPIMEAGSMGAVPIKKVYKEKNKYIVRIMFRDYKEYNLKISIDKNMLMFYYVDWFKNIGLIDYPGEYKYHKLDGPKIVTKKTKVENLRLRATASMDAKMVRFLKKGEGVMILVTGKEVSIDSVRGHWVKVLADNDDMGWCFDAFLE